MAPAAHTLEDNDFLAAALTPVPQEMIRVCNISRSWSSNNNLSQPACM